MAIAAFSAALASTGLAALTFLSAGGVGLWVLKWGPTQRLSPAERLLFSPALGYGGISLMMMVVGLFNAWTVVGAYGILVLGLALSLPYLRIVKTMSFRLDEKKIGVALVIALCVLCGVILSWAPITYYDSLVYHLAIPGAYVQAHHWISQKELIYPAFPQNLEMLWTFGLLLKGDGVANGISFLLALLTVGATVTYARRFLSPAEGWMAALLLSVMPAFLLLSSGGYVDIGLTLYVFLSFYAYCLARETNERFWLILAGLLSGLAMGIKYTGAAAFVSILCLQGTERKPFSILIKNLAIVGMAALVPFSPWLIKNMIYVGNPVFPFFYKWGNPTLNPWVREAASGYFRGLAEYKTRSAKQFLYLPWDLLIHAIRFGGGMDILGDFGWAPLILMAPFSFFCRKHSKVLKPVLGFTGLFVAIWALSRPVLRFLLPMAPTLSLLSAIAWEHVFQKGSEFRRGASRVILSVLIMIGGFYFIEVTRVIGPFPVALGLESRAHYLGRQLNYYNAARFVDTLPKESRVMILGDQRGYYYNRPVLVTPVFNTNPFTEWANESSSPDDLLARLKSKQITHLLINYSEMKRLDDAYHLFPFTPQGQSNWEGMKSHLVKLLYQDRHCDVIAL